MADDDLDFVLCLGDYIYAETEERGATAVRADRIGSAGPDRQARRRARSTTTARSTASTARTRRCGGSTPAFPTVMLWDDHEVQDNYAGGERDGGLPPSCATPSPASARPTRRSSSRCRTRRRPATASTARCASAGRSTSSSWTSASTAPTSRATTRSRPPARSSSTAARFLGQAQMDFVKNELRSSQAAWKVMANEVMMMPVKLLGDHLRPVRLLAGLPGRARAAAAVHQGQRHQGRRVRHRRHPHLHRRRRADEPWRGRERRRRVRRRLDHLARASARARPACCRATTATRAHRTGGRRPPPRPRTLGPTRPTSTTTATRA